MHARKFLTVASLGLSLTVAGCGTAPAPSQAPAATQAAVIDGAAGWIPSTFSSEGIWTAKTDENSPAAVGLSGIATISGHAITVRDGATGGILWSSAPVPGTPDLSFASDGGKEFLLATYGNGTAEARIDAYLTTRVGGGVAPESSTKFTAARAEKVTVQTSSTGALVAIGTARKVYRPSHSEQVSVSDKSVALLNDATLTVDAGAFGLRSLGGAKVWSSVDLKPSGAAPGSSGTFISQNQGLIVAKWPGAEGKDLVVLVRGVSGTVAAVAPAAAAGASNALLVSQDGRWAVYGPRVFNSATGAVYDLPADLAPSMVERAVVYSSVAHGNAYDAIGKTTISSPKSSPKLISPLGQGVFFSGTDLTVAQANTLGAKVTR